MASRGLVPARRTAPFAWRTMAMRFTVEKRAFLFGADGMAVPAPGSPTVHPTVCRFGFGFGRLDETDEVTCLRVLPK